MTTWTVHGNEVIVNDRRVALPFPIKQAIQCDSLIVVVLAIPKGETMTENVFAISADASIRWQIEGIAATASSPNNRYMDVRCGSDGTIVAGNWNANDVTVDVATGKVLRVEFTK